MHQHRDMRRRMGSLLWSSLHFCAKPTMRVYLDTEFADWDDPDTDLLSIGMVELAPLVCTSCARVDKLNFLRWPLSERKTRRGPIQLRWALRPAHERTLDLDQVARALELAAECTLVDRAAEDGFAGALQFGQREARGQEVKR